MALSEEEQKLLEQMEAALAAEDPKLAHTLRGTRTPRTLHRRRAAMAGFVFLAGCALLVAGMRVHWLVSVLGFVVMLGATVTALSAYQRVEAPKKGEPRQQQPSRQPVSDNTFMDKMEERWRRRQDEGL